MRHLWAGLVLAFVTGGAVAQTPLPERLGYVNDLAGAMDADAASQLGAVLSGYASVSGIHIAVVALENPVEESPESLAGRALANFLQDDPTRPGAVLLWTANGHVVVYVGENLRGRITDVEAQAVIDQWVIPASASDKVDEALTMGAYQLIAAANTGADAAVGDALGPTDTPAPADADAAAEADPDPLAAARQAALDAERDLHAIADAFRDDPGTAASRLLASAAAQAQALPEALAGRLPWIASRPDAVVWAGIVLGALLVALNTVRRMTRSGPALLCASLMALAVVVWLPTRFTELGLLVLLAGLLAPAVWLIGRRVAATATSAGQTAPPDDYAAWLAKHHGRQAGVRTAASQATQAAAAAPGIGKPAVAPAVAGAQSPALRRMSELLGRAHEAGTATPAFDRIVARWRTLASAEYKARRTGMIVMLIVLVLFFLPLAFLALGGWLFAEVNALRQPNQTFSEFFRQLSREGQALQRFQGHR